VHVHVHVHVVVCVCVAVGCWYVFEQPCVCYRRGWCCMLW
jgi:hypothetical protein